MKRIAVIIAIMFLIAPEAWARDSDRAVSETYYRSVPLPPRPPQPSTGLTTPNPLKASTSTNAVLLSWSNIGNETGYVIERRAYGASRFTEVGKTTANITSYKDAVQTTQNYQYRVRAYSAVGTLTYSPYTNTTYSTVPCE
jgi:hypothetical protein